MGGLLLLRLRKSVFLTSTNELVDEHVVVAGRTPNKALQLTRRHPGACGGPGAGGRPVGW